MISHASNFMKLSEVSNEKEEGFGIRMRWGGSSKINKWGTSIPDLRVCLCNECLSIYTKEAYEKKTEPN